MTTKNSETQVKDDELDSEKLTASQACLIFCCLCPLALGLIGAVIAYIVFGIIFLVDDYGVCVDDPTQPSQLWIFSLVALIMTFTSACVASELRYVVGGTDVPRRLIAAMIVESLVLIYGTVIIYAPGYVCDHLTYTGLYVWALVTYWLKVASILILLLFYYVITTDPDALEKMSKVTSTAMDEVSSKLDLEKGKPEHEPLVKKDTPEGKGTGEYAASNDLD